ncbi:hypothetical protein MTR67_017079 [Solanum verrucosum]|uniref:Uncharacterized protein n=1 Tax=Solanum verrucosum TaxID=315347 RepID=A0AAF0TLI6_SOLVR|nr:hypothetical protein MTR67_017079 [Solanum verrucosum]
MNKNIKKDVVTTRVTIFSRTSLSFDCFPGLVIAQEGISNMCIPQRPLFPRNDCKVEFANTPPLGISPSKSLNETLMLLRYESFSKDLGIVPDNTFKDKSKSFKLIKLAKDNGIFPKNELFDRSRDCRFWSSPDVLGIIPEKWLLERYSSTMAFSPPISDGISPSIEFCDTSR